MKTDNNQRIAFDSEKLVETLHEIVSSSAEQSDVKRENANVDGDTAMGSMLKFGSETAKMYYESYMLNPIHAKLHKDGHIHIHDLDFLSKTMTCCQIDIDKLFKGGFSTGHGHLREPNDIRSYASLACIALQSNQNDQHGGQSIPNFDYTMAKGVAKTFIKEYNKELKNALELLHPSLDDVSIAIMVNAVHEKLSNLGLTPRYNATDCIQFNTDERNLLANFKQIEKAQQHAHTKARKATEKATYQAMEALVHNLNSMHSRAGAQVPFSSINYGTDTTPEGRLVIENLLWATEAGLGKGETPIFPIQIFRLKKGVNFDKGDPNYDLFVLASYVSSKRLFPNFSFQDAPFNMAYHVQGKQETEIAYMGCAQKDELITYKIGNDVFVEGIGRAYSRLSNLGVNSYGISKYVDTEAKGIEIFDSASGGFVGMKKIIKNPNKNNWREVKFGGGRRLILTEDHPLPVEGKGRVFVKDLVVGDKVAANYTQYTNNQITEEDDTVAWLEGVILCDGCYAAQVNVTVGVDESDIQEEVFKAFTLLGHTPTIKEHRRGVRGNYNEIHLTGMYAEYKKYLKDTFGGLQKKYRQIPNKVFSWSESNRISFLAGMIDADAGMRIKSDNRVRVQIGSTNKELALQQMALAQSLGYNAALYINHYNKKKQDSVRYRIEFAPDQRLIDRLVSKKKKPVDKWTPECVGASTHVSITEINKLVLDEDSFDVETTSDKFDLSGVSSHNCRSRVVANVHDTTKQQTYSRGNLSFTSINLPRLAIEANGDINKFYESLDEMISVVEAQLLERFEIQAKKKAKNFPFLMGQGIWLDSEKLKPDDEIREVIKHGTLGVGFIGLAETLTALTGKHHGECEASEALGKAIVAHMRKRCDELCEKHKLNFSLIATPAEGLSGRFLRIDKKIYGERKGITDRDYYTNSFHIPVSFNISINKKIDIEAPYHALTNGGHITYVEVDKDTTNNIEAFMQVIKYMGEKGIGYGSLNHPVDRDPVCGYNGHIKGTCCPKCGREEKDGPKFERIRRITGYLVGTVDRFNNAKQAEERERVKHK